jgi:hypothetical protein
LNSTSHNLLTAWPLQKGISLWEHRFWNPVLYLVQLF